MSSAFLKSPTYESEMNAGLIVISATTMQSSFELGSRFANIIKSSKSEFCQGRRCSNHGCTVYPLWSTVNIHVHYLAARLPSFQGCGRLQYIFNEFFPDPVLRSRVYFIYSSFVLWPTARNQILSCGL